MTQTAHEIEAAIEAWINEGWRVAKESGDPFPDESKYPTLPSRYGATEIGSLTDLQYYLQYDKPKDFEVTIPGVDGAFEHEKQFGGEGLGDAAWFVLKIGDRYFRKDGWHQSHHGTEYDGDFTEVKSVQVLRNEWQDV